MAHHTCICSSPRAAFFLNLIVLAGVAVICFVAYGIFDKVTEGVGRTEAVTGLLPRAMGKHHVPRIAYPYRLPLSGRHGKIHNPGHKNAKHHGKNHDVVFLDKNSTQLMLRHMKPAPRNNTGNKLLPQAPRNNTGNKLLSQAHRNNTGNKLLSQDNKTKLKWKALNMSSISDRKATEPIQNHFRKVTYTPKWNGIKNNSVTGISSNGQHDKQLSSDGQHDKQIKVIPAKTNLQPKTEKEKHLNAKTVIVKKN